MSDFLTRQREIQNSIKKALDEPCDNEHDQQVHDRLKQYDELKKHHTEICARFQVSFNEPCSCSTNQ